MCVVPHHGLECCSYRHSPGVTRSIRRASYPREMLVCINDYCRRVVPTKKHGLFRTTTNRLIHSFGGNDSVPCAIVRCKTATRLAASLARFPSASSAWCVGTNLPIFPWTTWFVDGRRNSSTLQRFVGRTGCWKACRAGGFQAGGQQTCSVESIKYWMQPMIWKEDEAFFTMRAIESCNSKGWRRHPYIAVWVVANDIA